MAELHDARDPDDAPAKAGGEIAGGAVGAIAGGAIGGAIGGPVGAVIGAAIGAAGGAKAVDAVTPDDREPSQEGTETSAAAGPGIVGSGATGALGAPVGATAQAAVTGIATEQAGHKDPVETPETAEEAEARPGYTVHVDNSPAASSSGKDMPAESGEVSTYDPTGLADN